MAIKAGQYLLNPTIAGAGVGGAIGVGMKIDNPDTSMTPYLSNGAVTGAILGGSLWACKGYKNFKVGNFTNPLNDVDTSKITPGTKKLLENLF